MSTAPQEARWLLQPRPHDPDDALDAWQTDARGDLVDWFGEAVAAVWTPSLPAFAQRPVEGRAALFVADDGLSACQWTVDAAPSSHVDVDATHEALLEGALTVDHDDLSIGQWRLEQFTAIEVHHRRDDVDGDIWARVVVVARTDALPDATVVARCLTRSIAVAVGSARQLVPLFEYYADSGELTELLDADRAEA